MITYLHADAATLDEFRAQLIAVYQAAFSGPPYYETEESAQAFAATLDDHPQRPGFDAVLAQDANTKQIVGFAYGYSSTPGQWWHESVMAALAPELVATWFADSFELVELAVLPTLHGQGIGGRIHDELLATLPRRTAVLSTWRGETAALHLYQKRGWITLHADFCFPGKDMPYFIMGYPLWKRWGEYLTTD